MITAENYTFQSRSRGLLCSVLAIRTLKFETLTKHLQQKCKKKRLTSAAGCKKKRIKKKFKRKTQKKKN